MQEAPKVMVPLSELLSDAELGIEQVAGPREDVMIQSVATTELRDPTPYAVAGELLLTSGMGLPEDEDEVDGYVARLAAARITAFGIGLEPVLSEVPAALVAACDRHRMPLIRLPPRTPFVAVNQSFSHALSRRLQREFEREAQAQAALVGAAGGADPFVGVVRQLAAWIGTSVLLLDPEGGRLAAGGRPQPDSVLRILAQHAATLQHARTDQSAVATFGDRLHISVYVVPTGSPAGARLVLGVVGATALTLTQRRTIATGLWLLALLVNPRHSLDGGIEGSSALVRLLVGREPADVEALMGDGAGGRAAEWVVVRGLLDTEGTTPGERQTAVDVTRMRTALGTPYLDLDGRHLTALVAGALPPTTTVPDGWTLGSSRPHPFDQLPAADREARRALQVAKGRGVALRVGDGQDLSLGTLVDDAERAAFAHDVLRPLGDPSAEPARTLLATLHTWLRCHGSNERTARALEIHRNTVRHRLAQVETLLEVDLDEADTRATLWLATRWLGVEQP
ncbi:MAG TPA: PucR family transcriptional regulator [Nocardioides sp.]|nr:PucR family transcriptional regulator [Nocardioides sp.]